MHRAVQKSKFNAQIVTIQMENSNNDYKQFNPRRSQRARPLDGDDDGDDCFYIALFSALSSRLAVLACDSTRVTSFFMVRFLTDIH